MDIMFNILSLESFRGYSVLMVEFQDLEMTFINMITFSEILITFSNIKLILKYNFL